MFIDFNKRRVIFKYVSGGQIKTQEGESMATFKTPEELRAWSRSFLNKSQIIKRGFYNYIDPEEEKRKEEREEKEAYSDSFEESAVSADNLGDVSDIDAGDLASSIIAKGNASSANISELFSLDSSTIEEMNSKFPTTELQLSQTKGASPVLKK